MASRLYAPRSGHPAPGGPLNRLCHSRGWAGRRVRTRFRSGPGFAVVYLISSGGCGSLRRVPDEPLPDGASGLRAANAGLGAAVGRGTRRTPCCGPSVTLNESSGGGLRRGWRNWSVGSGWTAGIRGTPSMERVGAKEARMARQQSERERRKDCRPSGTVLVSNAYCPGSVYSNISVANVNLGNQTGEPTTRQLGLRRATSSHHHYGRTARQATCGTIQARFESAS